jgi:hypothetical protein
VRLNQEASVGTSIAGDKGMGREHWWGATATEPKKKRPERIYVAEVLLKMNCERNDSHEWKCYRRKRVSWMKKTAMRMDLTVSYILPAYPITTITPKPEIESGQI